MSGRGKGHQAKTGYKNPFVGDRLCDRIAARTRGPATAADTPPTTSMLRNTIILGLISIALAAALTLTLLRGPSEGPSRATVFPEPRPLPEFSLLDQRGQSFGRDGFTGRWNLVFFGFTHCPDVCPITLQQLAVARGRMAGSLAETALPRIVFVSVDPERDDVATVAKYTEAFKAEVVGLTGELQEIDVLTQALGVFHQRADDGGKSYQVDHSAAVIVIDDLGRYHAVFSAPHDIDSFVQDTLLLMQRT